MSEKGNIDEYGNVDSLNLKNIDGQNFTILDWMRSDFTDQKGEVNKGIKFTVREEFDGKRKLHTTRTVIVRKFYNTKDGEMIPTELGKDVKNGKAFAVRCELQKAKKGGNPYFDLVNADAPKGGYKP